MKVLIAAILSVSLLSVSAFAGNSDNGACIHSDNSTGRGTKTKAASSSTNNPIVVKPSGGIEVKPDK